MKPGSAADLRRRFRTGRPCLDLVHTGGEGELARWEIVHTPADLGRLLGVILGLPALPADDADLAAMRPLRAAVTRIAYGLALDSVPRPADGDLAAVPAEVARIASAVAGRPASHPADVAVVNESAAGPPLVPALRPEGGTTVVAPTVAAALATLARDAVDLFGGPLARRVRICAADDCGLLFVDASRPGRRRWCSMERCGNRAKIRTHRARREG
jgi:CGNR zinc finger/Putative stress-induced transcription regulator